MKAAGISRKLFDAAFAGITEPDPAVLKLADNQPEFTSTTSAYLAKAVTPIRIETGKQKKAGRGQAARPPSRRNTASTATSCSASGAWNRTSARTRAR